MRTLFLTLITCLFVLPAHAKYSGGTGEPNDPYQIATAADLIALGNEPNDYDKHFIVTADIDLDPNLPGRKVFDKAVIALDTDPNDQYGNFQGPAFTGVFDGNGHTITHLTIRGGSYMGLFGQLDSMAEVMNLGVVDVNVTSSGSSVGGLVGSNYGSMIHCYSTGAVRGHSYVGGLVGLNMTKSIGRRMVSVGRVSQCYSTGRVSGQSAVGGLVGVNSGSFATSYSAVVVTGNESVGGLVGSNWGGVTGCYSSGAVIGSGWPVGGLIGENGGHLTQCYSTGIINGSDYVGGLVGYYYLETSPLPWPDVLSDCFWDIQTSGRTWSFGGTGKTTAEMQTAKTFMAAGWDFVGQPDGPHDIWAEPPGGGYPILWWQQSPLPKLPFSAGTGEPNDPYHISTPAELNAIGHNPRLMGAHFALVNDIDLTGVDFYIIGSELCPFTGSFNGDGHTISHLTVTGERYLGLFAILEAGAEITDLGVVDVNITGSDGYIGGLVGRNGTWGRAGGVLTRCYSAGVVRGGYSVGGLVGRNWGFMTQCHSTGAVSGDSHVGGLIGVNYSTGTACYSTATVSGSYDVGGLVGFHYSGIVSHCYSTGAISGTANIGGLVGGGNSKSVSACFWDTQTSGQATSYGGTGKTTAEMQTAKTFLEAGWDFVGETANGTEDIWWILEGQDYPRLSWEAEER